MGQNGAAIPKQVRNAERPSERSERLDRLVRCPTECGNSQAENCPTCFIACFLLFPVGILPMSIRPILRQLDLDATKLGETAVELHDSTAVRFLGTTGLPHHCKGLPLKWPNQQRIRPFRTHRGWLPRHHETYRTSTAWVLVFSQQQ